MKKLKNNITSLLTATLIVAGSLFLWSCEEDEKTATGITPQATSITPNENVKAGATVTIAGTYLDHVKEVRFGTQCLVAKVDFNAASDANQIVLTLPEEAPNGEVYLIADDETVANQLAGTIKVILPVVTDIAPQEVTGGTVITITGTDLDLVAEVHIATIELTDLNLISNTELQATCPSNIAGGFLKLVTKADEEVQYTAKSFASIIPTITNVAPTTVSTGTVITITGTKLLAVEKVLIGGNELVEVTPVSDTELTAKCPSGLESGELKVITYNGEEVTYGASAITVNPAPVAEEVSNTLEKGRVVVTGTDLNLVTEIVAGGVQITSFAAQSATEIIFDLPDAVNVGTTTLGLVHSGGIITTPEFEVRAFTQADYIIFDFDSKTYADWANDLGVTVVDAGGNYYQVNETVSGGWAFYCANNTDLNISGLSASNYAVAFDLKVGSSTADDINLKIRLGDFWKPWQVKETYTANGGTTDWVIVYLPLSEFKNQDGNGDNLTSEILNDSGKMKLGDGYGVTSGWNGGQLDMQIRNIRFVPNP
jgi:hypothetical protein